ncbi:MAG: GNAT family N-acetyltransferase [Candidatus Liptonbacteria bacterium]|nr:GNAT family N-acetyltransferase [Candidatus Liptonbacteria bacterium]
MNKNFTFELKDANKLNDEEKNQLMMLSISEYPAFKKLYAKNKYYSTVKPQKQFIIKQGKKIIGTGKFLWRTIKVNKKSFRMAAFGVLISKKYQKLGLGTELIKRDIQEAKKKKIDLLYGSTSNPVAVKILEGLGFRQLKTAVLYKDSETKQIKMEKGQVYIFELKNGILKQIEKTKKFFIGIGPV